MALAIVNAFFQLINVTPYLLHLLHCASIAKKMPGTEYIWKERMLSRNNGISWLKILKILKMIGFVLIGSSSVQSIGLTWGTILIEWYPRWGQICIPIPPAPAKIGPGLPLGRPLFQGSKCSFKHLLGTHTWPKKLPASDGPNRRISTKDVHQRVSMTPYVNSLRH